MIELNSVCKAYGKTLALDNINLFVQEGEMFGIIGKSGAGKSTLIRTMNMLERPDEGVVIIDNQNITTLGDQALRQVRRKMAMIFQQFNLLNSKTVFENAALPLRLLGHEAISIHEKIEELLNLVGIYDKKDHYPSQLSGGQKQRVAIARALSVSPKVLLCDEATSALDPETTESILGLLKKINNLYGITMVMITHDMDVVKRCCHRMALMESGRFLEVASLRRVIENPESLARKMLFARLCPELPRYLLDNLQQAPNNRPLLRLDFQGDAATVPFISKTSRALNLDINILLANMDRIEEMTCGVLIVELFANEALLGEFIKRCDEAKLIVEVLGYVARPL